MIGQDIVEGDLKLIKYIKSTPPLRKIKEVNKLTSYGAFYGCMCQEKSVDSWGL